MSRLFYRVACAVGRPVVSWSVRCVFEGSDHLPAHGGALLASNHESYFDAMILSGLCPRPIRWLSAVGRLPRPVRSLVRALDVIPLAETGRDIEAIRTTIDLMREGQLVGGFPEGSIPQSGLRAVEGGPLQAGVFRLARLAGVPVIPCAVAGSAAFGHWRNWLPGSGKTCAIVVGEPLSSNEVRIEDSFRASLTDLVTRARALAGHS